MNTFLKLLPSGISLELTKSRTQRLLLCFVVMLFSSQSWALKTGYVMVTSNGDIIEGESQGLTLTFKYGEKPSNTESASYYDIPSGSVNPDWHGANNSNRPKFTKVVLEPSFYEFAPTSCYDWFLGFKNLQSIENICFLRTDSVKTMFGMFAECEKIKSLDLSLFNTRKVTDTYRMFYHCFDLETIYISDKRWTMGNVSRSTSMFEGCEKLKNYDGSQIDKTNADATGYLSIHPVKAILCNNGTLYFVNDNNAYSTNSLYKGNTILKVYDNTSCMDLFTTSPMTTEGYGQRDIITHTDWYNDAKYTDSTPDAHDIRKVVFTESFSEVHPVGLAGLFGECVNLESIEGLENLNTSKVIDMSSMFLGCKQLASLDLGNFDTSNVTSMYAMFWECENLKSVNVSSFKTENVEDLYGMFCSCKQLTSLDLSHFNTGKVKNMGNMFYNCVNLNSLDVSQFDTREVSYMQAMFFNCGSLTSLDVAKKLVNRDSLYYAWDTSKVTTMRSLFNGCSQLTSLDVCNWNTSHLGDIDNDSTNAHYATTYSMFRNCSSLERLTLGDDFNTAKVPDMRNMFNGCTNLKSITFGSSFSTNGVVEEANRADMFAGCPKLRYIDFHSSNDQDAITEVDRTTAETMFYDVPRTTVIYLPHGSSSVTDAENVVYTGNDPMAGGGGHGGGAQILKCPNYYSEDKVDIEFPRSFRTNKAEYSRSMSNTYGSVVLPYEFKSNDDIQAYTLDAEHTETMYFVDAATVPAHTPFAFKKQGNAEFVVEDETDNFGITVEATHTTSAAEGGTPYTHSENLSGWTTKGYYINETVNDYVNTFYIASDKFYRADGALTMYPHRVTFHGTWATEPSASEGSKFFEIVTMAASEKADEQAVVEEEVTDELPSEVVTAIEAADLRREQLEAKAIYDVQGHRLSALQKGLNIIRKQDGSVKKIMMK